LIRQFFVCLAALALGLTACANATPAPSAPTIAPTAMPATRAPSTPTIAPPTLPATPAPSAANVIPQSVTQDGFFALGNPSAPVTLIDYSDFM